MKKRKQLPVRKNDLDFYDAECIATFRKLKYSWFDIWGFFGRRYTENQLKRCLLMTKKDKPVEKAANEMFAALDIIIKICQDSLEDHFGDKIGAQIREAHKSYKDLKKK